MPHNPFDLLKRAGSWATTPLVDEESIAPYQDALDAPALERSPIEARLRGFGAGAMEGLRGMTSPLELAGIAAGGAGGVLKGLGRTGGAVSKASKMAPTLDVVEPRAVNQVAPAMDDVESLIGDLKRNLARVPNRRPPQETRGESVAEFTPRGGEGMFNMGREAVSKPPMDAYEMLMKQFGGRGR